ncbi:MAG: ATP-binding protein [Alkalispirochaeta sp.]
MGSALGHQTCRHGYTVAYLPASRLFNEIDAAKADGTISSICPANEEQAPSHR